MQVEEFTPNEYIAYCWQVGCDTDAANQYEIDHNNKDPEDKYETHGSGSCGNTSSQVIGENGMWEMSSGSYQQSKKGLECTVYSDSTYASELSLSGISSGAHIYWTTVSGNRIWHHQGTVSSIKAGHPNMS